MKKNPDSFLNSWVNKDSYLIIYTLPPEYDSWVMALEVDEKPTEDYNDIGALEKQVICFVELMHRLLKRHYD
jgi:26S proteasome regulatory subunit T5